MSISDRIRVKDVRLLSDAYGTLKNTTFEWRRTDGKWQTQHRETYDRGGAATILPYNLARRTVVLVRQLRYPAYAAGYDNLMIEAAAGLLDDAAPEERIRLEAEEEIGYRLREVREIFAAFMSPGVLTEKMYAFVAYDLTKENQALEEGEEIELAPTSMAEAIEMCGDGRIADGKTIASLMLFDRKKNRRKD